MIDSAIVGVANLSNRGSRTESRIKGLPIGWNSGVGAQSPGLRAWEGAFWTDGIHVSNAHFRLVITLLSVSLGASFWFNLLNKFIVVRSTVKPKEKSPEEKPK